MRRDDLRYSAYLRIMEHELVPAMGCTEPIAVAYCAAKAREILGGMPEKVLIEVSGNIIKNVKSAVIPGTGGQKGIEAAVAAGIIVGEADRKLEVLSLAADSGTREIKKFLEKDVINVHPSYTEHILDIAVTVWRKNHSAKVRIVDEHTNIISAEKDGETIAGGTLRETSRLLAESAGQGDYSLLTVNGIYDFACSVAADDVREVLRRQISCNQAIAEEGMSGRYGAAIGKLLIETCGKDVRTRARARAAAASDARMNGCELPVVINSGSGNQGITVSIPVIEYAAELGAEEEECLRALVVSNLITLHLKSGIGRLSAYCGAVSAGVGAGAGIAFLLTKELAAIEHTVINALAITSGIVCDGAKSSCAAKIATAVDAGIFGFEMYQNGRQFYEGEGLVGAGAENTIHNIGILGREGMHETDKKIIEIMTGF